MGGLAGAVATMKATVGGRLLLMASTEVVPVEGVVVAAFTQPYRRPIEHAGKPYQVRLWDFGGRGCRPWVLLDCGAQQRCGLSGRYLGGGPRLIQVVVGFSAAAGPAPRHMSDLVCSAVGLVFVLVCWTNVVGLFVCIHSLLCIHTSCASRPL